MHRIKKEDWLIAGMQGLQEAGDAAIRIDYLCKKLGVTKGSFYHHFHSMEDYVNELLHYWEQENTLAIIDEVEKISDQKLKAGVLNQQVVAKDHQVEVMIRSWAAKNEKVRHCLEKVDLRRIHYLQSLHKASGVQEQMALDLAKIEYAAFVGFQHLYRTMPLEETDRIFTLFNTLLDKAKA